MIEQARRSQEAIIKQLVKLGAEDIHVVRRSKHWAVCFSVNGNARYVTFTGTKTDARALLNQLSIARRVFMHAKEGAYIHETRRLSR